MKIPKIQQLAKLMRIPYFRDIFISRTTNGGGIPKRNLCIVNLDNAEGPGTYWVVQNGEIVLFTLTSFGNLQPSKELVRYLDVMQIEYNRMPY